MSPRILAFHHDIVSWNCRKEVQSENGGTPATWSLPRINNIEYILSRWPNLRTYAMAVEEYSTRSLSYSRDVYSAFSAVLTTMGRAMEGGILFGLPEMFFNGSLLWRPEGDARRRRDENGGIMRQFPTWSWLGWSGKVDTSLWLKAHQYLSVEYWRASPSVTIYPHISFNKIRTVSRSKEKIHNGYYEIAQQGQTTITDPPDLPQDWRLLYPIPLAESPIPQPWGTWDPIIEFHTQRLRLYVSAPIEDNDHAAFIFDGNNELAGLLRYDEDKDQLKQTCELICIGRMEADWSLATSIEFWELQIKHRECQKRCYDDPSRCSLGPDWSYRCYNVLWIEWEDGVAYRKGLGRIFEDSWDAADTEEVHVRLG
jgi:hypothetical protein